MLKHPTFIFVLVLAITAFCGCDDGRNTIHRLMFKETIERNKRVEQTLRNALVDTTDVNVQNWQQFKDTWPSSHQHQGFAWYEELKQFKGAVTAVTLIQDRYVFKAILAFEISSATRLLTLLNSTSILPK